MNFFDFDWDEPIPKTGELRKVTKTFFVRHVGYLQKCDVFVIMKKDIMLSGNITALTCKGVVELGIVDVMENSEIAE